MAIDHPQIEFRFRLELIEPLRLAASASDFAQDLSSGLLRVRAGLISCVKTPQKFTRTGGNQIEIM